MTEIYCYDTIQKKKKKKKNHNPTATRTKTTFQKVNQDEKAVGKGRTNSKEFQ